MKSGIVRPDLELAEKVEYVKDGNYLKFYFDKPSMIVIVRLGDKKIVGL